MTPPAKCYVYVDETGQDTKGQRFVVAVAVIPAAEQERARQVLERMERTTGKDKKWTKAKPRQRQAYMEQVLALPLLHGRLFYARFTQTTAYLPCLLHTIAGAVLLTPGGPATRLTILIDGLPQTVRHGVAGALRQQRLRIEQVRGVDERHDALMRLADALAGFVRHALQGRPELVPLFDTARRQGVLRDIWA